MTVWKNPKTKQRLAVGQLVHINATTRLGSSAIGLFTITGFTDEGIVGVPVAPRENYGSQAIRFQPEDITSKGDPRLSI